MNLSALSQLERSINQLSLDEQLWLIARLAHQLRERIAEERAAWESQLTTMAADPEIQNELEAINREFAAAEADGLEEM